MLPINTPEKEYHTLEEIRLRKEELAGMMQRDNDKFTKLWNDIFVKKNEVSKGEWVSSLVTNSITAVDTFLLIRKLIKNYGFLFGKKRK